MVWHGLTDLNILRAVFGPLENRAFSNIHNFVKKTMFLMQLFFLFAPYDFGVSFKKLNDGVKFPL